MSFLSFSDARYQGPPNDGDIAVWSATARQWMLSSLPKQLGTYVPTPLAPSGVSVWVTPEQYGAKGDGTTDDTAAIQAAIDAVYSLGGGAVLFGLKTYLCNGALRTDRGGNSILALPNNTVAATAGAPVVLIGPTPMDDWIPLGLGQQGAVLKTTKTGLIYSGTRGQPSLLGGPTPETANGFSYIEVSLVNLGFSLPSNPTISGYDLGYIGRAFVDHTVVATADATSGTEAQPTSVAQFGGRMPTTSNYGLNRIGAAGCYGNYTGLVANSDHFNADDLTCKYNILGLGFDQANANSAHGFTIRKFQSEWNKYHIGGYLNAGAGIGSLQKLTCGTIDLWDIEDAANGNWYTTTQHLLDNNATPNLRADIRFLHLNINIAGATVYGGLLLSGGRFAALRDILYPTGKVTLAALAASGVAQYVTDNNNNQIYRDVALTVTGGNVTAITVDGIATGLTSGTVIVPTNRQFSITYLTAPTVVATVLT